MADELTGTVETAEVETEPSAVETAATPTPAPEETAVDWKAKYEADIADRDKQLADLRAHQIAGMTQREREAYLAHLPTLAETQKLILKALHGGALEDLDAQIAAIEQKGQDAIATGEFAEQVNRTGVEVWNIGQSLGLDPNSAVEFKVAKQYFDHAQSTGDPFFLGQAVAEAERARNKVVVERHKTELAAARAQARKQAREEAGTLDLSGGKEVPGTGIATATSENIDSLYMKYDREHPNAKNPYEELYRRLIATGSLS